MRNPFKILYCLLCTLAVVLLISGITACSNSDSPEPEPEPLTAETVIMFFPYSGLEESIKTNINDIKSAINQRKGLGSTRIIIVQAINKINAHLKELKYQNGTCVEEMIDNHVQMELNYDDPDGAVSTIQNLLKRITQMAEARSYSLVIGSHGTSWLPAGVNISALRNGTKMHKALGSGNAANQIDNLSLVSAVTNIGLHFNYIFIDACLMANIETIYEYQNICDVYISSTGEVMNYGAPYANILDCLLRHNYVELVNQYKSFYSGYSSPYCTISAVYTNGISELARCVKALNAEQTANSDVLSSIQVYDNLNVPVFYDLKDYYHKVYAGSAHISDFDLALSKCVINEAHTDRIYSTINSPTTTVEVKNHCGLSTSSPTENDIAIPMVNTTGWYIATH